MIVSIIFISFVVLVCGEPSNECEPGCRGSAYQCIDGQCFCTMGFVPNPTQSRCVRCPGFGEKCYGACCNYNDNATLTCWKGYCQSCYDYMNTWICRESMDHMLLISSTQIAMASALVLGIIATFLILYKLCAATTVVSPLGNLNTSSDPRLSIGSLQFYIEERLRDAPPRYSRAPSPPSAAIIPASVYINAGFIHDSSIPPPPYTPVKEENHNYMPALYI